MPSRLSIIPAEALADDRLSDGDIRVLAALGTFTDRGGKCWPSCESVAEVAGCAIRSVRRSVAHLAKCGYVVREARYGRSNVYVVKLDTPDCTVPPPRTVESSPPDRAVPHNVVLNVPKNVVGVPEAVLAAASGYLTDPKTREARVGCLRSLLQGMTGKPYPPEVVVRGLEDMRVAGVDFRPVVVRTWCDRAVKLLQGEAGRRAAQGDSSVLGHPDANTGHWSEDEVG